MRRIITLDPHSDTPTSVMWLEDRVIRTIIFGIPLHVHVIDIVLFSHRGVLCVTKLRDITLGVPSILLQDDGNSLLMFVPISKHPVLFIDERLDQTNLISIQPQYDEVLHHLF